MPKDWPLGMPPSLSTDLPEQMLALVIDRGRYGRPADAVSVRHVPRPRLEAGDAGKVLVAILASGPNFNTNFAALGLPVPPFGRGDPARVHIPGSDAVGIVVDAGPAVRGLKLGQAVIVDSWTGFNIRGYETHDGFNAQFAVIEEERAIPVPPELGSQTPIRLAPLMLTYGTAYRAVVERLNVQPGESLLVMGGGKGTSYACVQLGKALGARVVLVGSNPELMQSLVDRGLVDAYVDRRALPREMFGPLAAGQDPEMWQMRTEPFRQAVFAAAGGPVDKVFEHTGGTNFPLLVSCLRAGGALAFFGATGQGVKGEYKETFFYDGRRYVMDARWVWMRQKQVVFRKGAPAAVLAEIGLPPGRRALVWGAGEGARAAVEALLRRSADVVVLVSRSEEAEGVAAMRAMGIADTHLLDSDAFTLPADMPDPLLPEGRPNPEYTSGYLRYAQELGKALWSVWGTRRSPDVVFDESGRSTLQYSTFLARDFDEKDVFPCGHVVVRGGYDLTISGSHMYGAAQAAEVVRLLANGRIVMEEEDLEVVGLPELPLIQQRMLDGSMRKSKGVALVQADRVNRPLADYVGAYFGRPLREADPDAGRFLDVSLIEEIALVTLTRPEALNALNEGLIEELGDLVRELREHRGLGGTRVAAIILTGHGRSFVAGADVTGFVDASAKVVAGLAAKVNRVFLELEELPVPVVALIDGFALGGGNELAMSADYRIATENARFGQPEVKLGIFPGYGGMQRLPRLVGPVLAADLCLNGEPIDAVAAREAGLVDEVHPAATAIRRAYSLALDLAGGARQVARRDWDAEGRRWAGELASLLTRSEVRALLSAHIPDSIEAAEAAAARKAAGRAALEAMAYGFEHGFQQGLAHDAEAFGRIVASPGGQEWIRRFLAKDPQQASLLTLIELQGSLQAPEAS